MLADLQSASLAVDLQGLNRLRNQAREESPEALRETARQFEAIFLQMMLKSMRAATPGDSMLGGERVRFYQELFDQQVAQSLAGRGFGLAEMLVRQLGDAQASEGVGEHGADGSTGTAVNGALSERRVTGTTGPVPRQDTLESLPVAEPAGASGTDAPRAEDTPWWSTPLEFVRELMPYAKQAATVLGLGPEVFLAQSALETGWGEKVMRTASGQNSFNVFGVKGGADWSGDQTAHQTLEYRDGVVSREKASFRAYPELGAAFQDYIALLQGSPRYREALAHGGDPVAFLQGLQRGGYATDPRYADKVLAVLGGETLRGALAQLKFADSPPTSAWRG